jgi:transcriptional regulator GlxA family with amidase domain
VNEISALIETCRSMVDHSMNPRSAHRGGLAGWQLQRVRARIDAHLSETISNRQLADCVRLSQFHFARAFRQSSGLSPQRYVLRRRIEHAVHLMLSTAATLCEIAVDCGFADQSHLSRRFAEAFGTAPQAWRRERTFSQKILSSVSEHDWRPRHELHCVATCRIPTHDAPVSATFGTGTIQAGHRSLRGR